MMKQNLFDLLRKLIVIPYYLENKPTPELSLDFGEMIVKNSETPENKQRENLKTN